MKYMYHSLALSFNEIPSRSRDTLASEAMKGKERA